MTKVQELQKIYRDLKDIQYLSNQQLFHYYLKVSKILTNHSSLFISVKQTKKTASMLITKYFTYNVLLDVQYQKREHLFFLTKALNIPIRELHSHFCKTNSKKQLILINTRMLMNVIYQDISFLKHHFHDETHEETHANHNSKKVYNWLNKYIQSPRHRQQFCQHYPKKLAPIVDSYRHIIEARIFNYYKQIGNHIFSYHRDRLIIYRNKRILKEDHGSYLLGNLCYGSLKPSDSIHHIKFRQLPQLKINLCSYLINNNRVNDNYEINRAKFLIENHKSFWWISKRTNIDAKLLADVNRHKKSFQALTVNDIDRLSKYYTKTHQDHVLDKNNHAKNV